jgi:hypothetical protein
MQSPGGSRTSDGFGMWQSNVAETGSLKGRLHRPPPLPSMRRFATEMSPSTPPPTPMQPTAAAAAGAVANGQHKSILTDTALLQALSVISNMSRVPSSPLPTPQTPGSALLPPAPPSTPINPPLGGQGKADRGLGSWRNAAAINSSGSIDLTGLLAPLLNAGVIPSTPASAGLAAGPMSRATSVEMAPLSSPQYMERAMSGGSGGGYPSSASHNLTVSVPIGSHHQAIKSPLPMAPGGSDGGGGMSSVDFNAAATGASSQAQEVFSSTYEVLLSKLDACRALLHQVPPTLSNVNAYRDLANTITALLQAIQALHTLHPSMTHPL